MSSDKSPSKGRRAKGGDHSPPTPGHTSTLPATQRSTAHADRLARSRAKDGAAAANPPARARPEQYSDEVIRRALAAYVAHGKFSVASDETSIPWQNIQRWARSPHWADEVSALKHAHAREVRAEFAAGAAAFVKPIADTKRALEMRCAQLLARLEAGEDVDGKELASMLRALAASGADVARLGDVVSDPAQGQGVSVPTRITLAMEVTPDGG